MASVDADQAKAAKAAALARSQPLPQLARSGPRLRMRRLLLRQRRRRQLRVSQKAAWMWPRWSRCWLLQLKLAWIR